MAYHYERGIESGDATIWIRQTVMYPGQHHGPYHPTGNEIVDPMPAEGFPGMVTECPRIHTYGFSEGEAMEESHIDDAIQHSLGVIAALLEARMVINAAKAPTTF